MPKFQRGALKLTWPILILLFGAMVVFRIFWSSNRDIPADSPERIREVAGPVVKFKCQSENSRFKYQSDTPCPPGQEAQAEPPPSTPAESAGAAPDSVLKK